MQLLLLAKSLCNKEVAKLLIETTLSTAVSSDLIIA